MIVKGAFGLALLLLQWPASYAFETMNRIRADGAVRVGVHRVSDLDASRARIDRLGQFLEADTRVTLFGRTDLLLAALERGDIDLVASPVDRARPLAPSLTFTDTVDLARLAVVGSGDEITVRYGEDEWHRALGLRAEGDDLTLRVASGPAALASGDTVLMLTAESMPGPGRTLANRQPRAWVFRADDRVLAFKLNRFVHSEALRTYAEQTAVLPPARLLRASLRGEPLTPWDDLAREHGRFHGLDWRLLLAVMYKESRFDPKAVSRSGARGLMQLKPVAVTEVGLTHYDLPEDNVLAGARYLAWIMGRLDPSIDSAERVWLALAAYNGGIGTIRRARAHAARMGRDPDRWDGHVEHSVREMARENGAIDAEQVIHYVADVRDMLATYFRVTESLAPRREATRGSGVLIAASP